MTARSEEPALPGGRDCWFANWLYGHYLDSQVSSHVASLLMAKSKLTTRENTRQEHERAKSLEDRSRQLMKKAAQLQQKAQNEDIRQAAARIAKQAIETK